MKMSIGGEILDYDGNKIQDGDGRGPLTFKSLLRMYTGSYSPDPADKNGAENSVIANAVALKVHNAIDEIELTDEEYEILKEAILKPFHIALVYSQVYALVHGSTD
jgi:hypothetical protein